MNVDLPDAGEYPPSNFQITSFVFRPGLPFVPREGLQALIRRLHGEGRLRSALRLLLDLLLDDPRDLEALTLAMVLLGLSRTERLQAKEPIGERETNDGRLAALYALCSHCRRSSWVPHNCLLQYPVRKYQSQPAGIQCWGCGYVMCRKCYPGHPVCPNCGSDDLRAPVYPTGRPISQLERRREPVVSLLLIRQGPIPPDRAWIDPLLELLSPDVLEDGAEILALPLHPWPQRDIEGIAIEFASEARRRGHLDLPPGGAVIRTEAVATDGLKVYLMKFHAIPKH